MNSSFRIHPQNRFIIRLLGLLAASIIGFNNNNVNVNVLNINVNAFLIAPTTRTSRSPSWTASTMNKRLVNLSLKHHLTFSTLTKSTSTLYMEKNNNEPDNPRNNTSTEEPLLSSPKDDKQEELEQEEPKEKDYYAAKFESIIDPIWTNPLFANVLFWIPFVANPKLRLRGRVFLNDNFNLGIAGPVTVIGLGVAIVYWFYSDRLIDIELATGRTEEALRLVREEKMSQFMGNGAMRSSTSTSTTTRDMGTEKDDGGAAATDVVLVQDATQLKQLYEHALREELELRLIQPGVKVPGVVEEPDEFEEKRAAARQFLGLDISEDGTLIPINGGSCDGRGRG